MTEATDKTMRDHRFDRCVADLLAALDRALSGA
jgi:hypothetical protein